MRTRVCQSKDKVREVPSNVNPEVTSQYTDEIFALQHFLFHFSAGGGSIGGDRQHGCDKHQHCGGYPEVVGPAYRTAIYDVRIGVFSAQISHPFGAPSNWIHYQTNHGK